MKNSEVKESFPTRYILKTWTLNNSERLVRVGFGEKEKKDAYTTILLVGETGVGKSTLINAIVNFMLRVESKYGIWFEIIETMEKQTDLQTDRVTVYNVFTKHSPFSLTVIDTPGFGKTEGMKETLEVAEGLLELLRSGESVQEVDAVCLVMSSSTVRLTDRQHYILRAILSLFSNDVIKNFVVLVTHASTKPTNSIEAIKNTQIPCAQTDDNEPVHF